MEIKTISGNSGIGTTTPSEVLSVNGNVSIEGTNCRDSGGSATCNNFVDIAELFPSSEPVDSGDVVVIDFTNPTPTSQEKFSPQTSKITSNSFQNPRPNQFQNPRPGNFQNQAPNTSNNQGQEQNFKIKKSAKPYDIKVIGVVSTQPAIVIEGGRIVAMGGGFSQNNTLKPAVALAGRVPVKITDENGFIRVGDLITSSSKPGHGMKCADELKCLNSVVGMALENQKESNDLILVMVRS